MADIENISEWRGKQLVDRGGEKIGKLQAVDTDTDQPVRAAFDRKRPAAR